MKCRNIFCQDHAPDWPIGCKKVIQSNRIYPRDCMARLRYNRVAKEKGRSFWDDKWVEEHDKYYGRKENNEKDDNY